MGDAGRQEVADRYVAQRAAGVTADLYERLLHR
jgi:hypothetical protein